MNEHSTKTDDELTAEAIQEGQLAELKRRFKKHMRESENWRNAFDERQNGIIDNCLTYASNKPSGLPGHQLMLIVAEMAGQLDGHMLVEATKLG
ncbi:unnamed protein product [marine sediment metagenome]|uniref:Uncharacterized protein n=1 Tax=marine sediment metagenome TaxID=412755 RepID=X0RG55_9ZZZZ